MPSSGEPQASTARQRASSADVFKVLQAGKPAPYGVPVAQLHCYQYKADKKRIVHALEPLGRKMNFTLDSKLETLQRKNLCPTCSCSPVHGRQHGLCLRQ